VTDGPDPDTLLRILWAQEPYLTAAEIAAMIGCSVSYAFKRARVLGLPRRAAREKRARERPMNEDQLRRLWLAEPHQSVLAIARALDCSPRMVERRARRLGLPDRGARRRWKRAPVPARYRCPVCHGPSPTPVHSVCAGAT
jgi:hypothetical protein